MTFKEFDSVKVKKDYPEYKLKKGSIGAIVECFQKPNEAYLVEFSDSSGEAICTEFFKPYELENVG
ncbi:DUF4926 domain-containing protein [Clostridium ljungdahlii]|uniref:DUF4926 domain-containing protein n=1 Tax=Clostridium ljungdahlii (strain ATCC 55383 / DSM 13528 / PETC) TaxID=748727 RepID=D8GQ92_CLOLD|nr:DUF4926 domain-containing protein [Clostridium ljungdahlii]ADK16183.1 hypothetical protein CLJU_c31350 [Clostridium ljungdahlii DSM 13528]OAA89948.1 hypothetical protein WX45_01787 [Clostridium ljungdahlii DSM 13528]